MMKLLFITWDIDPVLFSLGPLNIYYYSLMWILAFVMGWYVMKKILQTDKVSVELLDPLFLYAFLGVIIGARLGERSEEHTSELQSRGQRVCRLLLEKQKQYSKPIST